LLDRGLADAIAPTLSRLLDERLRLLAAGRPVAASWTGVEVLADRQALRVRFSQPLPEPVATIVIEGVLFPYDPEHRTFVNIYEGDALTQAVMDRGRTRVEHFTGTRAGIVAVIGTFIPAGIHHILIGPDHLLFLVGLMLVGGSVQRLVLIVTGFTLAHSVTLSLAALNVLNPPARLIEPAIALSIVYVGADNLLVRQGRDMRVWIAFAFGLVHGFGFAYVLRDMGLPAAALGWSLLSFNLGVEAGQLAVVVVVASVLAAIRARSERLSRRLAVAGSIGVILVGAYWFVQRIVFLGGS
jgi:hydrogenase/urease accessory protein HupE